MLDRQWTSANPLIQAHIEKGAIVFTHPSVPMSYLIIEIVYVDSTQLEKGLNIFPLHEDLPPHIRKQFYEQAFDTAKGLGISSVRTVVKTQEDLNAITHAGYTVQPIWSLVNLFHDTSPHPIEPHSEEAFHFDGPEQPPKRAPKPKPKPSTERALGETYIPPHSAKETNPIHPTKEGASL